METKMKTKPLQWNHMTPEIERSLTGLGVNITVSGDAYTVEGQYGRVVINQIDDYQISNRDGSARIVWESRADGIEKSSQYGSRAAALNKAVQFVCHTKDFTMFH